MPMTSRKATQHGCTAMLCIVASSIIFAGSVLAKDDDDDGSNSGGWTEGITTSVKDTFSAAQKKMGLDHPAPPPPPEASAGCPTISLLPGTEAQRVMAPGATDNSGLRYQYSVINVGRECAVYGNRVSIKVGADGRVLLGPMGAAGHFDVPIRVVVFSQSQRKPVESRLFKVPVSLPAGQTAAPFNFVSDAISVAIPQGRSTDYSIMVGIDPGKADAGAKPHHGRRQKAAKTASASGQ